MPIPHYELTRVAYVDIDAHHGDGVFYAFEDDPRLSFADLHEDGRFLYPGTGHASETGKGSAKGTKLNIPLPPDSGVDAFMAAWNQVENFVAAARPDNAFALYRGLSQTCRYALVCDCRGTL